MRGEVGKKTPKKEIDNKLFFMTCTGITKAGKRSKHKIDEGLYKPPNWVRG